MDEEKIKTILEAKNGDKNAIEKLIKEEQGNICTTLFYLKKDFEDVFDISQEILLKLSKKIQQLKNPKLYKSWLNQIILNSYYDYLRKNKTRTKRLNFKKNDEENMLEIPDYSANPSNSILNSELDFIIKTSINTLPIHYKIPITLREIQGLSYKEISKVINSSVGTVKSRIARAREIIKNDIIKYTES